MNSKSHSSTVFSSLAMVLASSGVRVNDQRLDAHVRFPSLNCKICLHFPYDRLDKLLGHPLLNQSLLLVSLSSLRPSL